MLQSEAPFILDGIYSLICPTIIDHLIYTMKTVGFWSQNNEPVTVSAQGLGGELAGLGGGLGWGDIKS